MKKFLRIFVITLLALSSACKVSNHLETIDDAMLQNNLGASAPMQNPSAITTSAPALIQAPQNTSAPRSLNYQEPLGYGTYNYYDQNSYSPNYPPVYYTPNYNPYSNDEPYNPNRHVPRPQRSNRQ